MTASTEKKNEALKNIALALTENSDYIIEQNRVDIEKAREIIKANPDKIIVVNTILLKKVFRQVRNIHNAHSHINRSYFLSFKKLIIKLEKYVR